VKKEGTAMDWMARGDGEKGREENGY